MPIAVPIVAGVLSLGSTLIDKLFPDPAQRDMARLELLRLNQSGELALIAEQSAIIRAEAESESWLARSWRPIVMLTFAGLIVARWLGWSAPDLSEAEYLKLWSIVEFGLGGYVVGRTGEKIVSTAADAWVKRDNS